MNRHRDHLAPSDLTDGQLEGIRNVDRIRSLRKQRLALKNDIRALYGTLKKAKHTDPDRYQAHEAVVKELARVRAVHRREKKVEFREDYFDTMPGVEIDKQIDQLLGKSPDIDSEDVVEEWNPPIPEYPFLEQARIADAFFGPDAESLDGERALARRIQVVTDMATLCKLRQSSRRGKPFNWNKVEKVSDDTLHTQTMKTRRLQSLRRPCHRCRHGHQRASAPSVSSRTAFHRRTACGRTHELTLSGVTCSEFI